MKLHFFAAALLISLSSAGSSAWAVTTLKKVQVTDGSQIDLFFDGKVMSQQIRTEFINDIIQVSLTDVSVYPAKISSISGAELTKVFAYQYAPKLVRCRFTVKGKAENFKDRLQVRASGKMLTVRLTEAMASDRLATGASSVARAVPGSAGDRSPVAKAARESSPEELKIDSAEEKALLERVMKSQPAAVANSARQPAEAVNAAANSKNTESQPLGGMGAAGTKNLTSGKPLPSPLRTLSMLAAVLGLFGLTVFIIKKVKQPDLQNHKGMNGIIGKFSGLGLGKKQKMIEVVANHYLGPKKSIAMVRISGRLLVLGVTNESINLITQLSDEGAANATDQALEELASESARKEPSLDGIFADILTAERGKPSVSKPMAPSVAAPAGATAAGAVPRYAASAYSSAAPQPAVSTQPRSSVRDQIKNRIGSMKQL